MSASVIAFYAAVATVIRVLLSAIAVQLQMVEGLMRDVGLESLSVRSLPAVRAVTLRVLGLLVAGELLALISLAYDRSVTRGFVLAAAVAGLLLAAVPAVVRIRDQSLAALPEKLRAAGDGDDKILRPRGEASESRQATVIPEMAPQTG